VIDDRKLQSDILAELEWEPSLNAAHIGVAVDQGVATLSGQVSSMAEKHAAELAARRVRGVRAIAQEIDVRLPFGGNRTDADIAAGVLARLGWQSALPANAIQIEVEKGNVTLLGVVEWQFQKEVASRDAREVRGVRMVINRIELKPAAKPVDVKQRIEQSLKRNAELEAAHISVAADGAVVTLTGRVNSWYERQVAEQAAWRAPGVASVANEIVVGF
jgi:osmotically-inducible protein OsmY